MTAALTVEGLHTYYGKSHILHGVNLSVAEGRITALLGRNGAGKTTTMRSLMGLTPAREGKITIFGQDTTRWPTYRIASLGVGYVPEGRRIFANLTVEENLKVPLERPGPWTIARIYELFPWMKERRGQKTAQMSGGEQQSVAIGRALVANPRVLLLDELSLGLAPVIVQRIYATLPQVLESGITVLLVEQDVSQALRVATHLQCLLEGHTTLEGTPAEVTREQVEAAYFGATDGSNHGLG